MKLKRKIQESCKLYFVLCTLYFVLFISCNKEEPIPAYIHIDKFDLTTNYVSKGSSSHKILDAWIYIDDQLIGAFEMPCTIPVLFEGSHTVKVYPGIKENGIAETRIIYPFYDRFEQTVNLVAGEITVLNPSTVYSQGADFSWIEDFEGAAHSICNSIGNPDTVMEMVIAPAEVFELTGSGGVFLTSSTSYFGTSCNKYTLPKGGAPVFLELNYNCNTDFNIGISGYIGSSLQTQNIALTLRPTNGWNKMYVNLTNDISGDLSSTSFSIFFSMLKDPDLSTSYIYIDNVKLIN